MCDCQRGSRTGRRTSNRSDTLVHRKLKQNSIVVFLFGGFGSVFHYVHLHNDYMILHAFNELLFHTDCYRES